MIVDKKPEQPEMENCETHGQHEVRFVNLVGRVMRIDACPICVKERQDAADQKEMLDEQERQTRKLNDVKTQCGISPRNFNVNFDSFLCQLPEQEAAKNKAVQFANDVIAGGSGCLIMVGNIGAGKTMLATAIADKVIRSGKRCEIIKVGQLIRDIKDTWRKDSDASESDIINHYSTAKLLILDEIGVQYGSDTEKMMIFEIIDGRYQNMKPTVLISNLDVEGVKQCIGERVYDRLRDDGGKVIAFTWPSMRGLK